MKVNKDTEVLSEWYFGIGLGIVKIEDATLIILPFIIIMINKDV